MLVRIFPCLRSAPSARMLSRISFLNKSPVNQSRCRYYPTSRCYFSRVPDSLSVGFTYPPSFFPSICKEATAVFALTLVCLALDFAKKKTYPTSMECRRRNLWCCGWMTGWIDRSMLVFREAKTMPVQQIVVNPVTLQQTNNKDRKVSTRLRTVLELRFIREKGQSSCTFSREILLRISFTPFALCLSNRTLDRSIEICKKMAFIKPPLKSTVF